MYFCDDCGSMITPQNGSGQCENCGAEYEIQGGKSESFENEAEENLGVADGGESTKTKLESLPTTKSGSIPKSEAMDWLKNRDRPSGAEMKRAMMEKPSDFEGSTYPTDISNIRVTGDARFIETVAGLLEPLLDLENDETRVEINLQRTKVRDTNQYTGNYALYLSVAERG